jgi:hypothetical protein
VPVETLVVQLAPQDVIERVPTSRLTTADARSAALIAGLHVATSLESGDMVEQSVGRRALSKSVATKGLSKPGPSEGRCCTRRKPRQVTHSAREASTHSGVPKTGL